MRLRKVCSSRVLKCVIKELRHFFKVTAEFNLPNNDFPNSFSDRFIHSPLHIKLYEIMHYTTSLYFWGVFSIIN
jgi:hypothetical protein